jgi:hypothetical protein
MQSKRGFGSSEYLNFSQDHLVVLALWFLTEEGSQTSFENLVAEAFESFPERFQLEGYPDWPNSHVIGKAWVRCRTDKRWMTGSVSEGFKLTASGEQIARKILARLQKVGVGGPARPRKGSRQTISSRVVLGIEKSPAYEKYKTGNEASISEYEFCDLLYSTLESTPEILEKNFSVMRQEAETYGRADLTKFLDELKARFEAKFVGRRSRGGLMPQKKET